MPTGPARNRVSNMRARRRKLLLSVLLGNLLVAGCTPGGDLPEAPPYDPTVYRLGVDDQVRVIVYGEDQLRNDSHVGGDGTIAIPLIGNIPAAGKTTKELSDEVVKELISKQIMRSPNATVEVTAYRPVTILGEVVKPGQFPYQPGMTVLTAVAAAGGFTYRAVQSRAYVIRQENGGSVEGKLEPQDYVKPGDVMKIYQRTF